MDVAPPVALWCGQEAEAAIVAVAVHAGHALRDEIAALMALDDLDRLREEDQGTAEWAARFPTRLVPGRSRFEFDLNRPRQDAVYLSAEDGWDLEIWRRVPPAEIVARSRAAYDGFYSVLAGVLDRARDTFGRFVVYDLHSYNHRRGGPTAPPADAAGHPDVNLGTGSMDRARWGPVVDRFITELGAADVPHHTGRLDVRENVCFRGRQLARWVHERYPQTGCALAIEVKKFFMDEHTGEVDGPVCAAVGEALAATVPGVVQALDQVNP
jgi:hypothetical protein